MKKNVTYSLSDEAIQKLNKLVEVYNSSHVVSANKSTMVEIMIEDRYRKLKLENLTR